ncbi:MAG: Rrf2 family transcriptional regulator [Paracoccaceae bacterium]
MQLGKFTDFGLRVLVHLAATAPDRQSARQIAQVFNVSEHHLAKVCSRLVQAGFLISERGRAGGLWLARPVDQITLGAVARALTKGHPLVECFGDGPCDCLILPVCGLKSPLAEAREAFFAALDQHTLQDVVAPQMPALRRLLADAGV